MIKWLGFEGTMLGEMRSDYLTDRWVIYAPGRAKRPSDFAAKRARTKPKVCPFCRGNECMTPPATLIYVTEQNRVNKIVHEGRRRRSDWVVRCVPNMYPAVRSGHSYTRSSRRSLLVQRPAIGFHEIIVESPTHDDHPHRASQEQIALWLSAAVDRVRDLTKRKEVRSVVLFRNHGVEAGASIAHAHSQLMTTPTVPPHIEEEHVALARSKSITGECALCQVVDLESRSSRGILSTSDFSVIAPWASLYPFEFWIIPKRHSASIVQLRSIPVEELSGILRLMLGGLAKLLSDPPYNLVFHLGPTRAKDNAFHWHIRVHPRLSTQGGFELGSGIYINTIKPEDAAQSFRRTIR
jgi:UDPglucose--hexose-1-phosphate uridylyltransferase